MIDFVDRSCQLLETRGLWNGQVIVDGHPLIRQHVSLLDL